MGDQPLRAVKTARGDKGDAGYAPGPVAGQPHVGGNLEGEVAEEDCGGEESLLGGGKTHLLRDVG